MLKGLNLGCGSDIYHSTDKIEWLNVDCLKLSGVDYVFDLNNKKWKRFLDDIYDTIVMNDVLEHLDDPISAIRNCYRILKKEGELHIKVVYWNHKYSFSDFGHKHAFSEITFKCLIGKGRPLLDFEFSDMEISFIYAPEAVKKYGENQDDLFRESLFHCGIIQGMNVILKK